MHWTTFIINLQAFRHKIVVLRLGQSSYKVVNCTWTVATDGQLHICLLQSVLFIESLSVTAVNGKWLVQVIIMNQGRVAWEAFRCNAANTIKVGRAELC